MPTVIVLIALPIFVTIILMCNNNDGAYDHVDGGNQERAELGKKVIHNTLAVPLLLIAIFFFV